MASGTLVELIPAESSPLLLRHLYADGDPGPIVAALAHVPELCEVALPFIGGALGPSAVSFRHKEIAILRTSANLACKFCVNAHTVVAFESGLSHSEVRALRGETRPAPSFSDEGELALIEWIDALSTGTGGIDPRLGKAVASAFGQHQLVELTVTVGATVLLNRFASGLGLPTSDDTIHKLADLGFGALQPGVAVSVGARGADVDSTQETSVS